MDSKGRMFCLVFGCLLTITAILASTGSGESKKSDNHLIYKQWQMSGHANSMNTAEKKKSMNKPGCAKCHTAEGYWQVILAGKPSSAPYKEVRGLTCITCHYPGKGSRKTGKLRVNQVEDTCSGCHSILVSNTATSLSWCSQVSIVNGIGAKSFSTSKYQNGAHSQLKKKCVTCHMAGSGKTEGKLAGGHTFRVITKGEGEPIFNNNACLKCHENISLPYVRQQQDTFKKLLNRLAALLPANAVESKKAGEMVPKFPMDPGLNSIEAKASFNYYMVAKDGTFGIHNPRYIRSLLQASINALTALKGKKQ